MVLEIIIYQDRVGMLNIVFFNINEGVGVIIGFFIFELLVLLWLEVDLDNGIIIIFNGLFVSFQIDGSLLFVGDIIVMLSVVLNFNFSNVGVDWI